MPSDVPTRTHASKGLHDNGDALSDSTRPKFPTRRLEPTYHRCILILPHRSSSLRLLLCENGTQRNMRRRLRQQTSEGHTALDTTTPHAPPTNPNRSRLHVGIASCASATLTMQLLWDWPESNTLLATMHGDDTDWSGHHRAHAAPTARPFTNTHEGCTPSATKPSRSTNRSSDWHHCNKSARKVHFFLCSSCQTPFSVIPS